MTGEPRILLDGELKLGRIVDGLHDILSVFGTRPFAIVGGIAVLTHVQGHRVTQDIDSAALGFRVDVRRELLVVADPTTKGTADAVLPNGVPVDLLIASVKPPRAGLGKRREATQHAARWAIETATPMELSCRPANSRGAVTVPVAGISALVAMKTIALTDRDRGDKALTDRLDLWRLLAADVDRGAMAIAELRRAPDVLRQWTDRVLRELFDTDPIAYYQSIRAARGAPTSIADVHDIWTAVVQPELA